MRAALSSSTLLRLQNEWEFLARHNQRAPAGDWFIWANITGRATGKTRTGAEWSHDQADRNESPGFLAARTIGDVEKVIIGHPRAGLLVTSRPDNPCEYRRNHGRVQWANGCYAELHTSEEPDRARGPQYGWGWGDEIGTWKRVVDFEGNTTWDNLVFTLRDCMDPRFYVGSTPRPTQLIQKLLEKGHKRGSNVVLSLGSLHDNVANLPDAYVDELMDRYRGTRIEAQEIDGHLLLAIADAILSIEQINQNRIDDIPECNRVVVGVDPALGHKATNDQTGINVSGLRISDGHLCSLADLSCRLSPDGWARRAVDAYHEYGASLMVGESNVLGEAIKTLVWQYDSTINVQTRTATKSKLKRIEPVLAMHERGDAHIVGHQPQLEGELTCFSLRGYEGDDSPDSADAHGWAGNELIRGAGLIGWDEINVANG